MSDETSKDNAPPFDQARWSIAVAQKAPVVLTADILDKIASAIYALQSSVFKATETISKFHIGDPTYVNTNKQVVDEATKSLDLLNRAMILMASSAEIKASQND